MNSIEVRCTCVSECTHMVIGERDDEWGFPFDFYTTAHPVRLRDKARVAWGVFRGQKPYIHALVIGAEDAERLSGWLARRTAGNHA